VHQQNHVDRYELFFLARSGLTPASSAIRVQAAGCGPGFGRLRLAAQLSAARDDIDLLTAWDEMAGFFEFAALMRPFYAVIR
jgi:hypothetical protein